MIYFEQKIGTNGAYAKYYLQEPSEEIDEKRLYPTIVICPGGAYFWTSFREDEAVALRFLAEGFHVVVVHYATEGLENMTGKAPDDFSQKPVSAFPNPVVSLAAAIAYLKEHAEEFHVNLNFVVAGGFSAGGNVAGQLGTMWHEDWLEKLVGKEKELYRPTHLLLAYAAYAITPNGDLPELNKVPFAATGKPHPTQEELDKLNPIKHVSEQTPPSFVWHTREDVLVPSANALAFCAELEKVRIPYELHLFSKGKHGLVLGDLRTGVKGSNQNAQVYKWVDLFLEWLAPIKTMRSGFYEPTDN
ncbi:alpha/beta hydrolase [Streptococcus dentiloxodontae]